MFTAGHYLVYFILGVQCETWILIFRSAEHGGLQLKLVGPGGNIKSFLIKFAGDTQTGEVVNNEEGRSLLEKSGSFGYTGYNKCVLIQPNVARKKECSSYLQDGRPFSGKQ